MPPAPLVDSHCHLDFPEFTGELDMVLTRARDAGVTRVVTICTRLSAAPQVQQIAEAHPNVFFAAGLHPMSVGQEAIPSSEMLVDLAAHPKMVGIGETGLDYHYTADSAKEQKQSLRLHIEAARRSGLPLIIHSRAADDDMAEILTEEYAKAPFTGVMHCFSSTKALAEAALSIGFYLSMSGILTFKKSQVLRDIFAQAPLDRILVETDAPYLAPTPYRGKRNEPAYTAHTAAVGAEVMGMTYDEFCARTTANFDTLFPKAAQPLVAQ